MAIALFDGMAFDSIFLLISIGLSARMGFVIFTSLAHSTFARIGGYAATGWPSGFQATLVAGLGGGAASSAMIESLRGPIMVRPETWDNARNIYIRCVEEVGDGSAAKN